MLYKRCGGPDITDGPARRSSGYSRMRHLLRAELVSEDGKILGELIPVLRLEATADVGHQLVEGGREALLLIGRLN